MDADVYGPNQPQMMGVVLSSPPSQRQQDEPPTAFGVKIMSMGFLMQPDQPVIWRRPDAARRHQAIFAGRHLGRARLSRRRPSAGNWRCPDQPLPERSALSAVIVTTPQSIAVSDVRKAVAMFKKLNVGLLGVIENMGEFSARTATRPPRLLARRRQGAGRQERHPVHRSVPLDPASARPAKKASRSASANPIPRPRKRSANSRARWRPKSASATHAQTLEIKMVKV